MMLWSMLLVPLTVPSLVFESDHRCTPEQRQSELLLRVTAIPILKQHQPPAA